MSAGGRVAAAIVMLLIGGAIWAHPLSVSYSRFDVIDRLVAASYRLPMDDMDLLHDLDTDLDDAVSVDELRTAEARLLEYLKERTTVSANGTVLEPSLDSTSVWLDSDDFPYAQIDVRYEAVAVVTELEVGVRLLTDLYPGHRNLAEFALGDRREEFVFQHAGIWSGSVGGRGGLAAVATFTILGIEHIVAGYDHLLFVLGLVLVGRRLRDLVIVVTAFTIAHSVTLALATLGVVELPSRLVEAAIAASIIYVGLENLVARNVRFRWLVAFAFGLVHGLGFAAILGQLRPEDAALLSSLFAFNLGVEIGQVAIVLLIWPFLARLATTRYRVPIVRVLSAAIVVCGAIILVGRVP